MIRFFSIALLLVASPLAAQTDLEPEKCMARTAAENVAAADYGGKSYAFTSEACRDQFLADPERYAQLYDALRELEAERGKPVAAKPPSLVPS